MKILFLFLLLAMLPIIAFADEGDGERSEIEDVFQSERTRI